jgi:hypothetical protein
LTPETIEQTSDILTNGRIYDWEVAQILRCVSITAYLAGHMIVSKLQAKKCNIWSIFEQTKMKVRECTFREGLIRFLPLFALLLPIHAEHIEDSLSSFTRSFFIFCLLQICAADGLCVPHHAFMLTIRSMWVSPEESG